MKVVKMLEIGRDLLKFMSDNGIKMDDYKYVDAYYEFLNMRKNHVKYNVAMKMLADELLVSERTLGRVFRRLSNTIE